MSQELCARGRELFKKASQADELFKARLLEFFSSTKKDDQEMKRIETLGESHREADVPGVEERGVHAHESVVLPRFFDAAESLVAFAERCIDGRDAQLAVRPIARQLA